MTSPDERIRWHPKWLRLSLFWRTFLLLSLLLVSSILAWLQTFRALEFEPRALQTARQIAVMAGLTRAALVSVDSIARLTIIKALADQQGVYLKPREPTDIFSSPAPDRLHQQLAQELTRQLGSDTLLVGNLNGKAGLWLGFLIGQDRYWLLLDRLYLEPTAGQVWLVWLLLAAALSLAGAVLMARLINRPLKRLSFATSRLREGDFAASRLDEQVATHEIREVNIGFNRMAQELSKVEQDRVVMLAGISHDLRTPLARLRLEAELSVRDEAALENMVADIDQLDAIIGKFLDYARPEQAALQTVSLPAVLETCARALRGCDDIRIHLDLQGDLRVQADEVDLTRVIANLLENARRYGKNAATGVAEVEIAARLRKDWVLLKVRDHGAGVAEDVLPNLVKPFFRGDEARTEATGAGLGLAIVNKTVHRMGGLFHLANSSSGGLAAQIKLRRAQT